MLYGINGKIKCLDERKSRNVEKGKYKYMQERVKSKDFKELKDVLGNCINKFKKPFRVREILTNKDKKLIFKKLEPLGTKSRKEHDVGLIVKDILIKDKDIWFVIKGKKGKKDPSIYTKIRTK